MARDTRLQKAGLDRNKYYGSTLTAYNKLVRDEEPLGVFYSTDYEPVRIVSEVVNGVKHTRKTVKLLTTDYIPDLTIDYFVLYYGEYWLVDSVEQEDIVDKAKPFSRHTTKYIIGLKQ